jgi:acyl-CoA reductase-like NAD-dependent aldehyde dehydrogenase
MGPQLRARHWMASDPASDMGAMINVANVERVDGLVNAAIAAGAKVIMRGRPFETEEGGYKQSGIGGLNGVSALDDFLEYRTIIHEVELTQPATSLEDHS